MSNGTGWSRLGQQEAIPKQSALCLTNPGLNSHLSSSTPSVLQIIDAHFMMLSFIRRNTSFAEPLKDIENPKPTYTGMCSIDVYLYD